MKFSKIEYVLIIIPLIALGALIIFIDKEYIKMEAFWSNLTYFLLAGIFLPLGTFISLRLAKSHSYKDNQYNAKKLNEEVFKKLTYVVCLEYLPFFENQFGFCIPKNPILFKDVVDPASVAFNIQIQDFPNVKENFDRMEDVIPSLEIGEDYLHKNYSQFYNMWIEIKEELDTINKDKQEFCNKVSEKIMNELKKHFRMNPTAILIPHEKEPNWAYFSDHVPKIISFLFNKFGRIDFSVRNPIENQFYVYFDELSILGFNKKENLDMNFINEVFKNVTYDDKLIENHRDFSQRLIKLNNRVETFCKQVEKRVVNDIDNKLFTSSSDIH